jgi:dolichol-phosphate mannosyltransferase
VVLRNQEAHGFFQGQILWSGFTPRFLEYRRLGRKVGRSRWTFGMKITLLMDGVLGYSFVPIRLMSALGIVVSTLGFAYAGFILLRRAFWGTEVEGFATLTIAVLTLGGIQMLMLGIIGEYLWRSLAQNRNRDPYVIDEIIE